MCLQADRETARREPGAGSETGNSGRSSQVQPSTAGAALLRVSGPHPTAGGSFIRCQTAGAVLLTLH